MYIMKCDRCGAVQEIQSILPIFGMKEDPQPRRKYNITTVGEFRKITLCQDCDAALGEWIKTGDRKTGDTETTVRHGRWKGAGFGDYYCSLCNETYSIGAERVKNLHYCPNCGARMGGGQNE